MSSADIVNLVIALVGVGLAAAGGMWNRRLQRDLGREESERTRAIEEHRIALQRQLDSERAERDRQSTVIPYRELLLLAARGLEHRLRNISHQNFLAYLDSERGEAAISTTLYRLASYFAAVEIIASDLRLLRLVDVGAESEARLLMARIATTFASDDFDRIGGDFRTSRFMIWREEQRAMGELCVHESNGRKVIVGYASFLDRLSPIGDRPWFDRFARELRAGVADQDPRFERLHADLKALSACLEADGSSAP